MIASKKILISRNENLRDKRKISRFSDSYGVFLSAPRMMTLTNKIARPRDPNILIKNTQGTFIAR